MFTSSLMRRGNVDLPDFSDMRIMMMPLVLGDLGSVPPMLDSWRGAISDFFKMSEGYHGQVGYLTIDEKLLAAGDTTRRSGLHVDGVYRDGAGAWGGGGWGSVVTGMLTASSHVGCRAWDQKFAGWPGEEGDCSHLGDECKPEACIVFEPGEVWWLSGLCVHESIPMETETKRQFVRLSMPSTGPWFDGYTVNPMGVLPTGPILPRRIFMGAV
jgi:hypothetical protein